MIYTDGIHLISDDILELHIFAEHIGLKRCWFHSKSKHKHYDLMLNSESRKKMLRSALLSGAQMRTSRELILILNKSKLKREYC